MSDAKAIAAVTDALVGILQPQLTAEVTGALVTTVPPDQMAEKDGDWLNLFLYQTAIEAAWRNEDPPGVRPGEEGWPALPLSLRYLMAPHAGNADGQIAQRMLGSAMRALHDHPVLGAQELDDALSGNERIRITPVALSVDELSKLWTTFQAPFRPCAAYQVGVILIESRRPTRSPAPVLERHGAAEIGTTPPIPTVESVIPPRAQPSALIGDVVVLRGHDLGDTQSLEISHRRLPAPVLAPIQSATPEAVEFVVPAGLPAGPCWVRTLPTADAPGRTSNAAALAIAPQPSNATFANGAVTMNVAPGAVAGQDVTLYLDRAIAHAPLTAPTAQLTFRVTGLPIGTYPVRIRVDGIDNQFIDRTAEPPAYVGDEVTVP